MTLRLLGGLYWLAVLGAVNLAAAALIILFGMYPNLPDLERLENYRPRLPLQIFSADGELLGEFGEEKRKLLGFDEFPPLLVAALLATEDQRFYQHYGVDIVGVMRASLSWLQGGRQGASTITMQVVRNFYLKPVQTIKRKTYEILLAYKIEHVFSKRQILEFYMNQIYLGRGSYGFAAAAKVYYGKTVDKLSLPEMAMLAGLPQAPSRLNPVRNPALAKKRQIHVLERMLEAQVISDNACREAQAAPLPKLAALQVPLDSAAAESGHVAEEVRREIYRQYGDRAYESGLIVHTTINSRSQRAAVAAVRRGLIEYTLRHPRDYTGPESYEQIAGLDDREIAKLLADKHTIAGLEPAIITKLSEKAVEVVRPNGARLTISGDGIGYVRRYLKRKNAAALGAGALVRIIRWPRKDKKDESFWLITQIPSVEGALVSLDPYNGKILAMAGGFDFNISHYNHITQALRQPGSSIKPFIYSAALEKGFTAATMLDDAPVFYTAEQTGSGKSWSPRNFGEKFEGRMLLRQALAKSKNMPTIRVLDEIGPRYARDYILRFGFQRETLPPYLTMALGAGETTPLQLAAGYATFANGGYLIKPSFIDHIEDYHGNRINNGAPQTERVRIIDRRNAYMIASLLGSVVDYGTGRRVKNELGRNDMAGKTGTTNNLRDAWFAGFNPDVVAVAWVGFDTPRTLGKKENGSKTALPLWIYYMREELKSKLESELLMPPGIVRAQINPRNGLLAQEGDPDAIWDIFYAENLPGYDRANADRAEQELL